jgi:transcriptional regulator with XRE-family HTH domain
MKVVQNSKNMPPFKTLGTRLKYLRERSKESLAEVSGAVEIDTDNLERIEQGIERPSEEILMLLMSHFNMQDSEAVQVWELAGYDRRLGPDITIPDDLLSSGKPVVMLLAVDVRTQYTDGVDITADGAGVTLAFTQAAGHGVTQPVARVGMSLEQAEAVSQALQHALLHVRFSRNKGLPAPKITRDTTTDTTRDTMKDRAKDASSDNANDKSDNK